MIGFWISIINGKKNKLSNLLYSVLINESNNGIFVSKWIQTIKNILISVPNLFNAISFGRPKHIQNSIKNTLCVSKNCGHKYVLNFQSEFVFWVLRRTL